MKNDAKSSSMMICFSLNYLFIENYEINVIQFKNINNHY